MYWILLEFATLLSAQSQLFNSKKWLFLLQILKAAIFTAGNPLGTPRPQAPQNQISPPILTKGLVAALMAMSDSQRYS